ncbi:NAD-dependent epimerase/dehydratase family protein [Bryobacter aggregatus]|uniref:NAD-dependent epimerase/dehydratase family protein n=1 Tax=Bryobacter aggregatus TaxID=360054 RepID=UPI0004E0F021|nr:NAD-dependent epimerase/dehydratase family protein [Bryobacter aggregatus]
MSRALVTGGCGFVGRHLLRRLFSLEAEVWCIDNLSTGVHPDQWLEEATGREELPGGLIRYHLAAGSLTFIASDALAFFLGQLGIIPRGETPLLPDFDRVFHLASVVGGRKKIDGDPMEVAIDLGIDSTFFLWAVRNKERIQRVLYASSSAAYPVHLQDEEGHVALEENAIDFPNGKIGMPDMTYGWSKLTGEYLSYVAAKYYGLSVACVRPFSGYGEDQDLTYPVPAIAFRAARGDSPIAVWGTGEQGRDFVHIEDCITALILAIDRISDGRGVNIGTGRLTNFKELASLFVSIAGYDAPVQPQIGKPVGVASRYANPTEMESLLGWKPEISLEEGMSRVLGAARNRVATGVTLED